MEGFFSMSTISPQPTELPGFPQWSRFLPSPPHSLSKESRPGESGRVKGVGVGTVFCFCHLAQVVVIHTSCHLLNLLPEP